MIRDAGLSLGCRMVQWPIARAETSRAETADPPSPRRCDPAPCPGSLSSVRDERRLVDRGGHRHRRQQHLGVADTDSPRYHVQGLQATLDGGGEDPDRRIETDAK